MITDNKLTVTLPSDLEIRLTREFDAPRDLVFEAMTECRHIVRWWGCGDSEVTCTNDFRIGGTYRIEMRMNDGTVHPFKGEYVEILAPERVVQTFIYDVDFIRDFPATETITLERIADRTRYTCNVKHGSKEARDGHLQSGMEEGAAIALDRLEALSMTLA